MVNPLVSAAPIKSVRARRLLFRRLKQNPARREVADSFCLGTTQSTARGEYGPLLSQNNKPSTESAQEKAYFYLNAHYGPQRTSFEETKRIFRPLSSREATYTHTRAARK